MEYCPSMNKLVEKFCNFSHAGGFCENMRNFISYVISKYGVNATIAISFVILGCLPHLIHMLNNKRPKPKPKYEPRSESEPKPKKLVRTRSFIIREVHSGYPALDRLLEDDYKHALVNPSVLDNADTLLKEHLRQEFPNLMLIQQNAARLEMSAREDDGEKILEEALGNAIAKNKPQEAYEIEMLLVEMLIYKGGNSDLKKALKLKCLKDESLKDARRPLYKAIIYKMQGKQDEAKKWWDQFIELRDPSHFGRRSDDDIPFGKFEHHVDRLKKAIQEEIPSLFTIGLRNIIFKEPNEPLSWDNASLVRRFTLQKDVLQHRWVVPKTKLQVATTQQHFHLSAVN